ncbi:MAG: F0F1 ATP synthase subunit B, partial [Bacteroidetes bacterium]|jgi:F-type H+-transporting ATPase subunit b|nr:F0F1 ATP synthase subunit B [Bacteroidota bacterium]
MELVKPSIGLIFWMIVSFSIILFLLKKFAWAPILGMIKEREESIEQALASAEKAKQEMKMLQSNNERILAEAKTERELLLKDAREIREKMIAEAKGMATKEGERLLKSARENIQNEKMAAITELKNQVATLSIDIAEKILKSELSSDEKQKSLVNTLLKDVNLN